MGWWGIAVSSVPFFRYPWHKRCCIQQILTRAGGHGPGARPPTHTA
jgi:hypothetical protein